MCGRFTQAVPWSAVWAFSQPLSLTVPDEPLEPRYNIAPTQSAWVIASDGAGGGKVGRMRWGLVPGWSKVLPSGIATFNARVESVAVRPTFRHLFGRRHCVVPAGGYYEWVGKGKNKQPWYVAPTSDPLMLFAGLWDRWVSSNGESLLSFSILTKAATGELAALHDRQPVIIPASSAAKWLSAGTASLDQALSLETEIALQWWPVGHEVGNVRIDRAELVRPYHRVLAYEGDRGSTA